MEFKIPPFVYFYGNYDNTKKGNTYTGSIGTNPETGCFNTVTFCYKLWLTKDEEDPDSIMQLNAKYWYRNPWNSDVKIVDGDSEVFEASEQGVRTAEKWLVKKMTEKSF
ncbi:MAG: hypothetical protein MJ236_02725 [Clostridia bacterium]|nr:hypothetical protein [Clostridia bacterium]